MYAIHLAASLRSSQMLRVSMFDAGKMIMEGRRGMKGKSDADKRKHFLKRNDAFFTDYGMMGLLVHQNYPKVLGQEFKNTKTTKEKQGVLGRLADATGVMSDFGLMENMIRGGDQHWELLTSTAALVVQTGSIAGGENGGFLPGFPEFPGWLGKNSSRGKHTRMLGEFQHHLNKAVGVSLDEIRSSYIPGFRTKVLSLMKSPEGARTSDVIEIMDEYGLSREDIFETLDEFNMTKKDADKFANLDSKVKSAFTRAYNSVAHKSQALVAEQGVGGKKKKVKKEKLESKELGVVDEDGGEEEDEDDSEDEDAKKVMAAFAKKGKKAAAKKGAAAKKKATKKKKT